MPMAVEARVTNWRNRLHEHRESLRLAFTGNLPVRRMLARHGRVIDTLLCDIWRSLSMPVRSCLVAVGGYGRKELFPWSDIDLLILLADAPDEATTAAIEKLVGLLWDIGLEVGHSVRTLDECLSEAGRDLTVQTNLLESRRLTGNGRLYREFRARFMTSMDARQFFEGKLAEQEQRHARYNDSTAQLEPNIKESPGGIRDLNNLRWLAHATGIGSRWSDLVSAGLLNPDECQQLHKIETRLFKLRARLHFLAGRREDRLLFNYQTQLTELYQIHDTAHRRASEMLMQRYYLATRFVAQMRDILLPSLRARAFGNPQLPIIPLNSRFQVRDNLLKAMDDQLFEREPQAIFECFLLLQQHPNLSGMSASTLRALWRARKLINPAFRRDPRNQSLFLQILRTGNALVRVMRSMNRYDILGRYIPAFGRIVGQMQHDLFHIYTVDEHILTVLRNLRRLGIPEFTHEFPLASQLILAFDKPELLYLAALFHDIAKGRGGDHSQLGMSDARRFCHQHGLPDEDTSLVVWLVREHLGFSSTAQKQDLGDPDVIQAFASRMPDERHLIALYLLTVCDIRGTSPSVWNAWKAKLIDDLFHLTRKCLTGGTALRSGIDDTKNEASRLLRLYGLRPHTEDALWNQLDSRYFMRHDAREISWHTRKLWWRVNSREPVVSARPSTSGEGVQVLVYMPNQPNLFSQICAFFEQIQYNIVDAQIHTTRHNHALDSFVVLEQQRTSTNYRDFLNYIEHELGNVLRSPITPKPGGGKVRISRQMKHFPLTPEVSLRADDKGRFYVLNLVAGDRPGLLSSIASVLNQQGIDLCSAKISTLGERAEDTFMIRGEPLENPQGRVRLETSLLQVLNL